MSVIRSTGVRNRLRSLGVAFCHGGVLLAVRTLIIDWPRPALLALIHLLIISAAARAFFVRRPPQLDFSPDRRQIWLLAAVLALALILTYWSLALASLSSLHLLLVCVGAPIADALPNLFATGLGQGRPLAFTSVDGLLSLALMWPAALLFTFRDVIAFDGTVPVVCGAVLASATLRILTENVMSNCQGPSDRRKFLLDLVHVVAPRSALLSLPLVLFIELPLLWSRDIQSLAETSSAHAYPALWAWLALSAVLAGLSVLTASGSSILVFPIHPKPTTMLAIGETLALVHLDLIATNIKIAQVDFRIMFVTIPIIVLGMAMYEKHVVKGDRCQRPMRHGKDGSGEMLPMSATEEAAYAHIDTAVRQAFKQSDSQGLLPSASEQFILHNETGDSDDDNRDTATTPQFNLFPNSSIDPAPHDLPLVRHSPPHPIPKVYILLAFLTAVIALLILPGTLFKAITPPTPTCPATYTPTTTRRSEQPNIPRLRPPSLPASWPGPNEPVAHLLFKIFNAQPNQYSWDYRTTQPNAHSHRVLVLHADDRPLQSLNDVGRNAWALHHSTMGSIYGAWWALRHGYDYRRINLDQAHTPQGGWGKPKIVYDALFRGYDVVVLFDSDAYPQMPEVGVEEMMARWGMVTPDGKRNASVLMAMDPPYQLRANENATNTGFWIVRNTPVAKRALKELSACPESIECRKWWTTWPAEQAAFTKLVRTKMKEGDELIIAPCEEANGWWEFGPCQGKVVSHAWGGKHLVTANMIERMVEWLVDVLDKLLRGDHYHFQDTCVPWKSGSEEGERCKFLEDEKRS